jgi:hypothetical protein
MTQITVDDAGLVTKHPLAKLVYQFDYDTDNLNIGVTITTSTMTLTVVSGANITTPASIDSVGLLAGNRKTTFRLIAGVSGTRYRVTNEAVTNETPAQTKVKYIDILVQ